MFRWLAFESNFLWSPNAKKMLLVLFVIWEIYDNQYRYSSNCYHLNLYLDRFYLLGVLKFLTMGGFFIWWLVDICRYICGNPKDGKGRPLK
jgi:hypothetical protein